MAESRSVARHHRKVDGNLEEDHASVEVVALRENLEVGALREGPEEVEAKRKREDQADAEDNFCVLYRE